MVINCEGTLRKIGVEKNKTFLKHFDSIYDRYKIKALEMSYTDDLILIKERGKVLIYICLKNNFGD
jgi:hypothetical protein